MIYRLIMDTKIKKQINVLLNSVSSLLTKSDRENAKEFIKHAEWGLAFDLVCTQLYEYDKVISADQMKIIKNIAKMMQVDDDCWNFLEQNFKKK